MTKGRGKEKRITRSEMPAEKGRESGERRRKGEIYVKGDRGKTGRKRLMEREGGRLWIKWHYFLSCHIRRVEPIRRCSGPVKGPLRKLKETDLSLTPHMPLQTTC